MDYIKYFLPVNSDEQEILVALLAEYPFDSFEEMDDGLSAYMPEAEHNSATKTAIAELLTGRGLQPEFSAVAHKNWNAIWEASFEPIRIPGKCLVRAKFHEPEASYPMEIIIQPEMAFGTGHHATTFLMMKRMFELKLKGTKVFDFGCGTGILSILAAKLDAKEVLAIDNDRLAYDNTMEQLALNSIDQVRVKHATLEELSPDTYDIILANINRNVLLATMQSLSEQLILGGDLLLSGILAKDLEQIKQAVSAAGLKLVETEQMEDWICLHASK